MSDQVDPAQVAAGEVCIDCEPRSVSPPRQSTAGSTGVVAEDPLDATTFTAPINPVGVGLPTPLVTIEYCHRCKFGLRANWIQQELLSTFAPTPENAGIAAVMLVPNIAPAAAGRFRIYLLDSTHHQSLVVDRKCNAGFPDIKLLKQHIRDLINPSQNLGHSDRSK